MSTQRKYPIVHEYTAPSHWASYLINGDASSLDEQDQAEADAFVEHVGLGSPVSCEDAGFIHRPDFGEAADCQTYSFLEHRKPRLTHKYAPKAMLKIGLGRLPVQRYVAHPPGQHPPECPLVKDCTAVEFDLGQGLKRWYGCERAYINARLRMVLVFKDLRDEVVKTWRTVPTADRVQPSPRTRPRP